MDRIENISKIPTTEKYIGYLWLSDNPQPQVFHNPTDISGVLANFSDMGNPFIIEGYLYNKEKDVSYSIKYVDGKHIVIKYDLKNQPEDWIFDEKSQLKKFIPNRLNASKIVFRHYWIKSIPDTQEEESSCLGMPVLVPGPLVFTGFEY